MAEEDLIFGKNRHFFGGIEPSNMINFDAADRSGGIKIYLTFPDNTILDNQILCTVAGVVIRKSTNNYPKDEFSGTEVANLTFNGTNKDITFFDTDVSQNTTYYYSAFPYTAQGVYNRNAGINGSPNRAVCKKSDKVYGYLYGFDISNINENPNTRVSYPLEVDNYKWGHVVSNKTGANYGLTGVEGSEWLDHIKPGIDFTPKPCMLNFDGTVAEYLDPYDYTKNINGNNSTLNTSGNNTSNAMMEWPKIYTKREEVNGVYKFRCSDTKIDESWDCFCNYDRYDNVIDHFYTAIYPLTSNVYSTSTIVTSATKYRSLCNCQYLVTDESYIKLINRARENGDDWDIEQLCDRLLINDLLILITKSTDVQSTIGNGAVWYNREIALENDILNYSDPNGPSQKYGLFYGDTKPNGYDTGSEMVKVFGMINWYGARNRVVAGYKINNNNSSYSMHSYKKRRGTGGYNENNTNYDVIKYCIGYSDHGYVKQLYCLDFGRVPASTAGSSSTYECDNFQQDQYRDDAGVQLATAWGGSYSSANTGASAGFYSIYACGRNNGGISSNTTSLSCKPSKV